jgi:hypothetical protein
MPNMDRSSYDTTSSQTVQGDLGHIVGQLETLIGQRQTQVNAAMADFQADGVSDQYHGVEQRWNTAASEVRSIIALVKSTLVNNDESAQGAITQAGNAVANIG